MSSDPCPGVIARFLGISPGPALVGIDLPGAANVLGMLGGTPRPDDPLASDGLVSWIGANSQGEVVIDYSSGVELTLWRADRRHAASWRAIGSRLGSPRYVRTIRGRPALVLPACAPGRSNEGGVAMNADRLAVLVAGNYPVSDLVRVAGTISFRRFPSEH